MATQIPRVARIPRVSRYGQLIGGEGEVQPTPYVPQPYIPPSLSRGEASTITTPITSVQPMPTGEASTSIFTAIPHTIGRALGGGQVVAASYDPRTGERVPAHLKGGGMARAGDILMGGSGQSAVNAQENLYSQQQQNMTMSNQMLDKELARTKDMMDKGLITQQQAQNHAQMLQQLSTSGIVAFDSNGQMTPAARDYIGKLQPSQVGGAVEEQGRVNEMMRNPNRPKDLALGQRAVDLGPALEQNIDIPQGGAVVNPLTGFTGAGALPTSQTVEKGSYIGQGGQMMPSITQTVAGMTAPQISMGTATGKPEVAPGGLTENQLLGLNPWMMEQPSADIGAGTPPPPGAGTPPPPQVEPTPNRRNMTIWPDVWQGIKGLGQRAISGSLTTEE